MARTAALVQEVRGWRLLRACVWHFAVCYTALWLWAILRSPSVLLMPWRWLGLTFSLSKGFLLVCSAAPQLGSILSESAVMVVHEPAPLYATRFSAKLPLQLSLGVSKVGARLIGVAGLAATGALIAAQAAAAATFFAFDCRLQNGGFQTVQEFVWSLGYGVVLSCTYCVHLYSTSRDVLRFPPIQRHRYFRIKQSLPEALRTAVLVSAVATGLQLLATLMLPQLAASFSFANLWTAALGSVGLTFCWAAGHNVLHVVSTDRLVFDSRDEDPPSLVVEALKDTQEPLLRSLALLDLCTQAEVPAQDWRRAALFADEAGAAWQAVGAACVAQVQAAVAAAGDALTPQAAARAQPGAGGAGQGGGGPTAAARWNVLPQGVKSVGGPISRQQADAMWLMRSQGQATRWAVRTLGAVASASASEDVYGVLQLCRPSLGDVTVTLASLLLVLQQYLRHSYSLPLRQLALGVGTSEPERDLCTGALSSQGVDPVAYQLQDAAQSALYRICTTFGPAILTAVRDAGVKPQHGSMSDVQALIKGFLAFQE